MKNKQKQFTVLNGNEYGHVPGHNYNDVDVTITLHLRGRWTVDILETWGSAQGEDEEHGRRHVVGSGDTLVEAVERAEKLALRCKMTELYLAQSLSEATEEARQAVEENRVPSNHRQPKTIMQKTHKTQKDLMALAISKIDTTSFRKCYERNAPEIERFIVVAPDGCLAEIGAYFMKSTNYSRTLNKLFENGHNLAIVGPISEFLTGPEELKRNLRDYLTPRLDMEVRALYLPPLYLVQFTGRRWE